MMTELDDREIARRIARFTFWGFDEALQALEAGGEAREDVLSMLRSSEQTRKVLDEVAELRGASRRPRLRFLW
jgi:hypothetical protein